MQLTLHIILTFKYCCWYCFFCKAQAPSKSGYAHASHPGQFVLIRSTNIKTLNKSSTMRQSFSFFMFYHSEQTNVASLAIIGAGKAFAAIIFRYKLVLLELCPAC